MPTYGYRCSNCGHEFEIRQKITDQPLKVCPECQGKLAKILYPVGISFKGSGFYSTDYKGSGNGTAGSSNERAAADGSSTSKAEAPAESKPDKKSESKSDSKTEKKAS
jgi:putative FmdB family regulatory protein